MFAAGPLARVRPFAGPREQGSMSEAVIAQKGPYAVDVVAGKTYWWCACGRSAKQPFCDGSHKTTTFQPRTYTAETTTRLWFCGCKRSSKAPICDGTHGRL